MNESFNNNVGSQMNGQQTNGLVSKPSNNILDELLKDKSRLIGLIGGLVVLIASFLPFMVAETSFLGQKISESTNYWSTSDGKIVFFVVIATMALIFFKKIVYSLIPLVISIFVFIVDLFDIADASSAYSYIEVKWGLGIYISILGFIAMGVSIFLYWKDNKDCFKDVINKFKNKKVQTSQQPNMYSQQPVQPMMNNNMMNQPVQPQPMMDNNMMNQPVQPQPMNQPFGGPVEPQVQPQPMNDFNNQNNNF